MLLLILNKLFLVLSFIIAVVIHEYSHGWMALRLGDDTALESGRLSLNPLAHIDPVGTILLPLLLMAVGFIPFGWAKAVPINPYNLSNQKKDVALVSFAGPASNFILATIAALLLRVGGVVPSKTILLSATQEISNPFLNFLFYLILVNLFLGFFNLMPIPPLDGSKIVSAYLPRNINWKYKKIAPYGILIIFILLYFNILGSLIGGLVYIIIKLYSIGG
jgi:Zn-dependent protease